MGLKYNISTWIKLLSLEKASDKLSWFGYGYEINFEGDNNFKEKNIQQTKTVLHQAMMQ